MQQLKIPKDFCQLPFYNEESTVTILEEPICESLKTYPFFFDILFKLNQEIQFKPWINKYEGLNLIIKSWKTEKEKLAAIYKKRDTNLAKTPMIQQVSLFIDALFWMNGKPVSSLENLFEKINSLNYSPINVVERLQFILDRPSNYHSYVQLNELFIELEKLYERKKLIEKN